MCFSVASHSSALTHHFVSDRSHRASPSQPSKITLRSGSWWTRIVTTGASNFVSRLRAFFIGSRTALPSHPISRPIQFEGPDAEAITVKKRAEQSQSRGTMPQMFRLCLTSHCHRRRCESKMRITSTASGSHGGKCEVFFLKTDSFFQKDR